MKKSLQAFQQYLVDKAYNLSKRPPNPERQVRVYIDFHYAHYSETIVNGKGRGILKSLIFLNKKHQPESITVKLKVSSKSYVIAYHVSDEWMDKMESEMEEQHAQMHGVQIPASNQIVQTPPDPTANIEAIIEKRWEEEKKKQRLEYLEKREKELEKELESRDQAIEKMQEVFENMSQDKDELNKIIDNKSKVEYFAGIFGDILESFGIQKEVIAKPLAGFLSGGANKEVKHPIEREEQDESGIVEGEESDLSSNGTDESIQTAIKQLQLFVTQIDTTMLFHIYGICTEIQKQPELASEVTEFIKNTKHTDHE